MRAGWLGILLTLAAPALAADGEAVYQARCAVCHGERRPGSRAPRARYQSLHRALGLSPDEDQAVRAWLVAREQADLSAPAPALPNPPERETLARGDRPPLPPRWVLEPWKWKNEHQGPDDVLADVQAMELHGIPCGVYLIDAPWETGYNTLRFYPERWRQDGEQVAGARLVRALRARGLKVIVWITPILNDGSQSNPGWDPAAERALYAEAEDAGLFYDNPIWRLILGRGLQGTRIHWWKGVGSHLDLQRPEPCRFWYRLLDRALVDLRVDGFKCDGGWPPLRDEYYFQTAAHTARRTGGRGITISRPLGGNLRSAVSCWTGDEKPTYEGMRLAMLRMELASRAGYSTVGSDIGGFKGGPSPEVLIRWAQLGCFSGVMELGGGGVHEPWELGDRCGERYQRLAALRMTLIPYLHSYAHVAQQTGAPLMRWAEGQTFSCGDELFVAPVLRDDGRRRLTLPPGRWLRFDDLGAALEGEQRETFSLDQLPVYVREGATLPLEMERAPGWTPSQARQAICFALYPGAAGEGTRGFDWFWGDQPGVAPTRLALSWRDRQARFTLSGRAQPYPRVALRVLGRWGSARAGYGERARSVEVSAQGDMTWVLLPASQEGQPLAWVELER